MLTTDPLDAIHLTLEAHGIAAARNAHDVCLAQGDLRFEAAIFDKDQSDTFHRLVLEIYIFSPLLSAQPVIESFAGWGGTRDQALAQAFEKFLRGVFHVLIEGLAGHVCDNMQAEIEYWRRGETAWKVFCGPVVCHSQGEEVTLARSYPTFFEKLEGLFIATASQGGHFVRVFVGSHDREVIGKEVLLDNETWQEGENLLLSQNWQCSEKYQSLRQVIMALPEIERKN